MSKSLLEELHNCYTSSCYADSMLTATVLSSGATETSDAGTISDFMQRFRERYFLNERLSVDDLKGISADFAAICRRVSEHLVLVLPSVFPIDE